MQTLPELNWARSESAVQKDVRKLLKLLRMTTLKNPAACRERPEVLPDLTVFLPGYSLGNPSEIAFIEMKTLKYPLDKRQRVVFGHLSRTVAPVFVIGCQDALAAFLEWTKDTSKGSPWIYLGTDTHNIHGRPL